jgi:hypothetical protein
MTMAVFNRFEAFSEHLCEKIHDLNADLLKVYLTANVPDAAADAVKADLVESVAGGNGYTAGGEDTQNATSRAGAVTSVTGVDITWTASGGTIGPFRYAVLYNDTPAAGVVDPLIGWWDYGAPVTLAIGESFVVDFGASMLTVG